MFNVNRPRGKRAAKPAEFNPLIERKSAERPKPRVGVSALKMFVPGMATDDDVRSIRLLEG